MSRKKGMWAVRRVYARARSGLAQRRGMLSVLMLSSAVVIMLSGCSLSLFNGQPGGASAPPTPRYNHIFLIVMENTSYDDIIGSSNAPKINALAKTYGLATNYWAVTHPSEPNYVSMIGGDYFNINNDNSYKINAVNAPNLGSQLEAAGMTWKSYQQSLPYAGYTGEQYPSAVDTLYASKHNPFMNFLTHYPPSQRGAELAKSVPLPQLSADLANNTAPDFSFISPDLCHDMHGALRCPAGASLITAGDTFVSDTVQQITQAPLWSQGHNAVVVVWDEADAGVSFGPGGLQSQGGHVAAIVISNHGPRAVQDRAPYNHYSLLLSIEQAFGLGCLRNSCPAQGGVQPMTPLFKYGN